jgi:hypothetical protein
MYIMADLGVAGSGTGGAEKASIAQLKCPVAARCPAEPDSMDGNLFTYVV